MDSEVFSSIGGKSSSLSGMIHLIAKEYDEVLTTNQDINIKSHAKRHDSNTSSNVKWETIVKTSNLHHDHVRYSQVIVYINSIMIILAISTPSIT